jgi:hypothetical protein
MKLIYSSVLACMLFGVIAPQAFAESMRCKGDIIDIGDTKADVMQKCGNPEMTDSFCAKISEGVNIVPPRRDGGTTVIVENCENVDIWTYNPGKGQFWTHLYFARGKLREMRYGDRVE